MACFIVFLKCHFFLTVCACQAIKNAIKRVNNNSSVNLLPRVLRAVKFNPTLQKEIEERGIKKINDYPEIRCGYIYVCQGHLRRRSGTSWWDKKEIRKIVVGSDFFQRSKQAKVTLMTLKLALEPLFFFALEFLQNDSWTSPPSVVFTLE